MGQRLKVWSLRVGLLVLVVGGWVYAAGPGGVSRLVLPPIREVALALGELASSAGIWYATLTTIMEILIAAAGALVLGFSAGFLGARSRLRAEVFEPLFGWGYMVPFVLFYPLFLLWMGAGIWSKIAYGLLNGFFPIALSTMKGFRAVSPALIRAARAYGARPRQVDWAVKVPGALPVVASGIRIGIAVTMITVILAEMLGSVRGLGFELAKAAGTLQVARNYALIAFILGIVGLVHVIIRRLERKR